MDPKFYGEKHVLVSTSGAQTLAYWRLQSISKKGPIKTPLHSGDLCHAQGYGVKTHQLKELKALHLAHQAFLTGSETLLPCDGFLRQCHIGLNCHNVGMG